MRLSAWQLEPHVKAILEGVLLWAADSKNRFKLKVRPSVPLVDGLATSNARIHYGALLKSLRTGLPGDWSG